MSADFPVVATSAGPLAGPQGLRPAPAPWAPEPPDENSEGTPQVARIVGALNRYKWMIVGLGLLGALGGVIATKFVAQTYEAVAKVWIQTPKPTTGPQVAGPIRAEELVAQTSWPQLFQSFAIMDSVVAKRGLAATPEDPKDRPIFMRFGTSERPRTGGYSLRIDASGRHFTLAQKTDGAVVDTGTVGDSIGRSVGFRWAPAASVLKPGRTYEFSVISPRDASTALLAKLQPPPVVQPNSNFMSITLVDTDPVEAAATLNTWLTEFDSTALWLKRRNVSEYSNLLEVQRKSAYDKLREAELKLEGFRTRTITMPSEATIITPGLQETRDPVFKTYFERKQEASDLQLLAEALARALTAGPAAPEAISAIPNLLTQAGARDLQALLDEKAKREQELRDAQKVYTDEVDKVKTLQKQIADLRTRAIPAAARSLLAQLQKREGALNSQIAATSEEIRTIPTRSIEEQRLRREQAMYEGLYTNLSTRYADARLAEASAMPDITILDRAAPSTGIVSFRDLKIIGAGILLALGLGLALAILLDRLDHKFRHLAQVSSDLALPVLGTVPKIAQPPRRAKPEDAAEVIESFRGIRLRLQYAYSANQPLLCGVTSPEQGDGKSLVASNLALAFAEAGYRTLLIDADTRRGALHEVFGAQRRPGLIEVLSGEVTRDEVLHPTSQERLSLMPCGGRRTTNPELIASPALPALLSELVRDFSVIIVDGPPLSAGIDAFAIGAACENTLMILRHSKTDMRMAKTKLALLRRLPLRTVGVVLNDVKSMGDYKYYGYDASYRALPEERAVATV
jgi:capsular exopolysaccharide synthesis family protein